MKIEENNGIKIECTEDEFALLAYLIEEFALKMKDGLSVVMYEEIISFIEER